MTVLERLKAAGYDPAKSIYPDSIGSDAGSLECGRVLIHTSFCRPAPFTDAIRVKATAFTGFSDGSERPYPDGWPNSVRANVVLFFDVGVDFRSLGRIETSFSGSDNELRYRVLSRCIQDCKYFLGAGSRFSKNLWGGNVQSHLLAMHVLWDSFSADEKPEWTSLEEIEQFSKKMLEEEIY